MSYVDFNIKDLKRMLSILSDYFGDREMSEADRKLRNKLESMHEAEVEYEADTDNINFK